jgi:hypothetical protein
MIHILPHRKATQSKNQPHLQQSRRTRWTMRWKPAPNAFAITFADRWLAADMTPETPLLKQNQLFRPRFLRRLGVIGEPEGL